MDFAKKYWEEFEKLSIDLLKLHFKDIDTEKISVNRTQSQKDGGYDGIVIISSMPDKDSYKILSESKLRAISSKDLPMSDFSKTLVIAINLLAHELHIFTNLHFSRETQKRISEFSKRTNIKVKLLDIFHVAEAVKKLPVDIITKYSKELLDGITDSVKKHPQDRITSIQPENNVPVLEEFIGKQCKEELNKAIKILQHNSGIFIVSGRQGSGKSLFIQKLISLLCIDRPYPHTYIDVIQISNINDFFISLLSVIWQIDALDIAKFTKEDIEEITNYIPDEDMSKNAKGVLLDIITTQSESCFSSMDLMYNCLMEYLYRIYTPILNFQKQFLIFHNIDYATDTVKDILLRFMKRFYKENIVIIIEARTEILDAQEFIKKCKKEIEIIDEVEIPNIEKREYLIKKYSNVFENDKLKILEKICPPNPLLIDQIAKLFSSDIIVQNLLDDSEQTIHKLYTNPNYLGKICDTYVNHVMRTCDKETQICAASIAFMDGSLETTYISSLCNNLEAVMNELLNTSLFLYRKNAISIYHASILKPLQDMKYISNVFTKNKVYDQLYDIIDSFDIFLKKKRIKKLYLALVLDEKKYVLENWEIICADLIKEHDYEVARELLEKITNNLYNDFNDADIFSMRLWIFQCHIEENIYDCNMLESYIQEMDIYVSNKKSEISIEKKEDYLFLKAKYYLAVGNYEELIRSINQYNGTNSRLYYIKTLGIKHINGIDSCIESLKHGMEIFPDDKYIHYSYYDHMLSKSYKCDLSKTKEYIKKMEQYIDILSLEDMIHFKYNVQAVAFYNNELNILDELNKLMNMSFQNNLPVEQSRICNLIGQVYWARNELSFAIEFFNKAAELQLYTNHQTYWWISNTNLALLYYASDNMQQCIKIVQSIFQIYRSKKWNKIRSFFSADVVSMQIILYDKEIVSFLLLLSILYKNNDTVAEEIINEMFPDNKNFYNIKWLSKKFLLSEFHIELKQTSYYVYDHYMIKC